MIVGTKSIRKRRDVRAMERAEWLKQMREKAEALYDHFSPQYWVTFGLYANDEVDPIVWTTKRPKEMKLLRRLVAHARPKEREKGQEDSPSPSPLLGRRMIPHGGRECNSGSGPIGLSEGTALL